MEFSIKDSGIGMEKSFLENLVEKINDENSQFQANTTGSCMGLIISNKLAFLLGKTGIQIESQNGEGTTVTFNIFDQNYELLTEKKGKSLENIIIPYKKMERLSSIIDFSKKIEWMRRKIKTMHKRNNTNTSESDKEDGGSDNEEQRKHTTHTESHPSMSTMLKSHNFDDIKKNRL